MDQSEADLVSGHWQESERPNAGDAPQLQTLAAVSRDNIRDDCSNLHVELRIARHGTSERSANSILVWLLLVS